MKKISKIVTLFFFLVLGLGIFSIAEEITLTTYYPAPYGEYEELRARKFAVGSTATMPTTDGEFTCEGETTLATSSGNVGIGTEVTGPAQIAGALALNISSDDCVEVVLDHPDAGIAGLLGGVVFARNDVILSSIWGETGASTDEGGIAMYTVTSGPVIRKSVYIKPNGDFGIGIDPTATLHVNGNVKIETVTNRGVGGNVKSLNWSTADPEVMRNNDIAELFDASEEVEAGEVLVVDDKKDLKLRKSAAPYEKGIVGIVSGSPAILFEGSQLQIGSPEGFTKGTKPPVALAGRVPCKVSLENGPIERGDLLTSSSTPGHAMKATDREKSFGTILGKALEPFDAGPEGEKTGKIVILVTLQ